MAAHIQIIELRGRGRWFRNAQALNEVNNQQTAYLANLNIVERAAGLLLMKCLFRLAFPCQNARMGNGRRRFFLQRHLAEFFEYGML